MKDTIKIRKGNKNQEPCIVYITGKNQFDHWVGHSLNKGEMVFSDDEDLIDFDYYMFEVMLWQWKYDQADIRKDRIKNELDKALKKIVHN